MSILFDRQFKVAVGSVGIETGGLHVAFSVERDTKPAPNTAEIAIWNLNPEHRAQLASKPEIAVSIEAGYRDSVLPIFLGVLRRAVSVKDGTDWVTRLSGGDGTEKLKTLTISKAFTAGTPIISVLRALASALGLGLGNLNEHSAARTHAGGTLKKALAISGPAAEELGHFCRSVGLSYSVQNGALLLLRDTDPVSGVGPLISPATGLLGSATLEIDSTAQATRGKSVVSGKSLLLPDLVPGRSFRVESKTVTGNFACTKTKHTGDSHGTDWHVEFEGVAL